MLPLFQVYIGKKYQGCVRAKNESHAMIRFASGVGTSPWIYQAQPASSVQDLKKMRKEKRA